VDFAEIVTILLWIYDTMSIIFCNFANLYVIFSIDDMYSIESYSYLNGLAAGCCLIVYLLCGMQLCWNVFSQNCYANKTLSRLLGAVFIGLSCSVLCYIISTTAPELDSTIGFAGRINDNLMFAGIASIAYVMYANNQPKKWILVLLTAPFVFIAILNICLPDMTETMTTLAAGLLTLIYIAFGIALQKREKHLDDLYSNRESHSMQWIWVVVVLSLGWWAMRTLFIYTSHGQWYDIAMYFYVSCFVLFVFRKVSHYGIPVAYETQKEIEQGYQEEGKSEAADEISLLHHNLIMLLENEKPYQNPDIKIDDVAKQLGTNARSLSEMLHCEMHTSFSLLINEYRINQAKELLEKSDEKISNLAYQCGFNSNQVFFRTFAKITGTTPSEWRKIKQETNHKHL